MKKIFIAVIALLIAVAASAQTRAIGLRIGSFAELSYQQSLGGTNFLEADLGISTFTGAERFVLTGVYDFTLASNNGFTCYAGPGAQLGLYNNGITVAAVGQLGVKYDFAAVPIGLSLDIRPTLYIVPAVAFGWNDICLGVRYNF